MDYLNAVNMATGQVRRDGLGDGVDDQTCLLLAISVGQRLAPADRVWSLLVLDVAAVAERLYPRPEPIVLTVDAPAADTTEVRAAVVELLAALAERYDRASAVTAPTSPSRRLALAEAAIRLRDAAGLL